MNHFLQSFLEITNGMSPYLLLGFLIAGVLHVFVPKKFYHKYLSQNNRMSVVYAALLGIPLPLCSCGVIPTAIGLKREGASKGAVASFLIATPQTGIDSILATFSLMGLGFAIIRPVAALITGICGGLLVNHWVKNDEATAVVSDTCTIERGNPLWRVLKYAYFDMMQDIGLRLFIGLLLAALINVVVPDEFFLTFGHQPLLQMLVILIVAVPMYICSTGSIPIAAALMLKGLSPGAALVMLMAGPAVNIASILVVRKSLGRRFTWIYLLTIVGFAVLFGLLINALGISAFGLTENCGMHSACCHSEAASPSVFQIICSSLLLLFIIIALSMKFFSRFKKQQDIPEGTVVYTVEGMHCSHCKASVEQAVGSLKGVTSAEANPGAKTLTVTGTASADEVRKAVESVGLVFKGESL
ncbi:MAG: permease [Bacteroidales bacterium]|nr:permease [Bacteroidales bacterium]